MILKLIEKDAEENYKGKPIRPFMKYAPRFVIVTGVFWLLLTLVICTISLFKGNIGFALSGGLPSLFGLMIVVYWLNKLHKHWRPK